MSTRDPAVRAAAEWMLAQILKTGALSREEALRAIPKQFGRLPVRWRDDGRVTLSRRLRDEFSSIARGTVTWDSATQEWRRRDPANEQTLAPHSPSRRRL